MCGIVGAIGPSLKPEVICGLLEAAADRGRDATGAYLSRLGDDNILIKNNVPAHEFVKSQKLKEAMQGALVFLGHTRAATQGSPDDNMNNHPIETDNLVGVHNGVIRSSKLKDYQYRGLCDSEVGFSLIETKSYDGLAEIEGSAALAWCCKGDDRIMLWRKSSPCHIGTDGEGNVYFGSTAEIIRKGAGKDITCAELEEFRTYQLELSADRSKAFIRPPGAKITTKVSSYSSGSNYYSGTGYGTGRGYVSSTYHVTMSVPLEEADKILSFVGRLASGVSIVKRLQDDKQTMNIHISNLSETEVGKLRIMEELGGHIIKNFVVRDNTSASAATSHAGAL